MPGCGSDGNLAAIGRQLSAGGALLMPTPRVMDSLSADGKAIMMRGFAERKAAAAIVREIEAATGEKVAPRTMSGRAAKWRAATAARQIAHERIDDLVAAMNKRNLDASQMIRALALDRLIENPDAFTDSDPIKVQRLSLQGEQLTLKRQELALRERALRVLEKKTRLLEAREERAKAALADGREILSPEQRLAEIKAIYGLTS